MVLAVRKEDDFFLLVLDKSPGTTRFLFLAGVRRLGRPGGDCAILVQAREEGVPVILRCCSLSGVVVVVVVVVVVRPSGVFGGGNMLGDVLRPKPRVLRLPASTLFFFGGVAGSCCCC